VSHQCPADSFLNIDISSYLWFTFICGIRQESSFRFFSNS
jgi:hypothetical protein